MSYKTFQNGFPLPGSDLNNYLMNQVVATFANSTARSSAIASPQEGQVTYLEDDNKYYKWDGSAWVELAGMTSQVSQALSPNYIINGAFDIWQRGDYSGNPAKEFAADRWALGKGGGNTNLSYTKVATGDTTNLPDIQYAARVGRVAGTTATSQPYFTQDIETVNSIPLSGKSATLSFWARAGADFSASGSLLGVQLRSGLGTDESMLTADYTSNLNLINTTKTLTTTWQRFAVTATVRSNSTQLGVFFFYSPTGTAGTNDYFEITGVQLEAGSVATPFRRNANSLQGELAACQRYYQELVDPPLRGVISGSSALRCSAMLPTTMRANPTTPFTYSGTLVFFDGSTTANATAIVNSYTTTTSVEIDFSLASSLTTGRPALLLNAGGGKLKLSAEL